MTPYERYRTVFPIENPEPSEFRDMVEAEVGRALDWQASLFKALEDVSTVLLATHRDETYLACQEDCWCWELEAALNTAQSAQKVAGHHFGVTQALLRAALNIQLKSVICGGEEGSYARVPFREYVGLMAALESISKVKSKR